MLIFDKTTQEFLGAGSNAQIVQTILQRFGKNSDEVICIEHAVDVEQKLYSGIYIGAQLTSNSDVKGITAPDNRIKPTLDQRISDIEEALAILHMGGLNE